MISQSDLPVLSVVFSSSQHDPVPVAGEKQKKTLLLLRPIVGGYWWPIDRTSRHSEFCPLSFRYPSARLSADDCNETWSLDSVLLSGNEIFRTPTFASPLFFFFFYCHCEVSVRRTDEEARKKRIAFFLCLSLCRTSGKEAQGLYKHVHSVYSETDVTNQSKKIKKHTTSTFNPPPPPPFPFSTEGTPELTTWQWACQASNTRLRRRAFFYLSIRGNVLHLLRGAGDSNLHRWWLCVFLLFSFFPFTVGRWLTGGYQKQKSGGGLRSKKKKLHKSNETLVKR